jgi:hypothetical protein
MAMKSFAQWLRQTGLLLEVKLVETYYSFNPAQYNQLFDDQLTSLMSRVSVPSHRTAMDKMQGFNWTAYIAACLRHAGFRDQREIQEYSHDIVVKLLLGTLFRGFDDRTSGPIDLRFKRAVANAVKNAVEKRQNRRRLLPTVAIGQEFEPGSVTAADLPARPSAVPDDDKTIQDFRRLVQDRLGQLAIAVLDARLQNQETKGLVGRADLGYPGAYTIKMAVQQIKVLAWQYASGLGNPAFFRDLGRAMDREQATATRRRATMAAKQVAVS